MDESARPLDPLGAAAAGGDESPTIRLSPPGFLRSDRVDERTRLEADEITPVRGIHYQPWRPVPGPVDRVSFFEEQRRHRRATWRLSAVAILAVLVTGIPVSLVLTPVVHTVALLLLTVLGWFGQVPAAAWESYRSLFLVIFDLIEDLDRRPIQELWPRIALAAGLMVAPGVVAMGVMWVWLGRVFARVGAGAVLLTLGAREPRPTDLEERQLVNVVEEMAIAAGVPPPRVMLIDADVTNAAVVGSSPADATVVVSRRLLDEIDRDDTQGVLGHLIGAVGNGDLKIAFSVVRVFLTYGLATTIVLAPVSSAGRATLWTLARFSLGRRDSLVEAEQLMQVLTRDTSDVEMDDVDKVVGDEAKRARGIGSIPLKVRVFALFPLWFAGSLSKIAMMMLSSFMLEPLIAFLWRTRRLLADATAVQLTRDPDGLASALTVLERSGGVLPGGRSAVHMFIVGAEVAERRAEARLMRVAEEARRRAGDRGGIMGHIAAGRAIQQEYAAELQAQESDSLTGEGKSIVTFHPPLHKRLERLRALGASIGGGEQPRSTSGDLRRRGLSALLMLVTVPLGLLAASLGLIALGLMMLLVLGATLVYMAIIYGIFSALH